MMNIENIFDQVEKEGKILSEQEMTVYYIWNAYTWTCMEGLAGYLTGYNNEQFFQLKESLRKIGALSFADKVNDLEEIVIKYGGLNNDKINNDIFSESDIGKLIDNVSDCFTENYDDWNIKLDKYVSSI